MPPTSSTSTVDIEFVTRKVRKISLDDGGFDKGTHFTEVPFEVFGMTCESLSPADLFALSCVCRRFRDFLYSECSSMTQHIWRNARVTFTPEMVEGPLEEQNEHEYTQFLFCQKTCQLCLRTQTGPMTIHWEFQVRCCNKCFEENTISHSDLIKRLKFPRELFKVLPCIPKTDSPNKPKRPVPSLMVTGRIPDPPNNPSSKFTYWIPMAKRFQDLYQSSQNKKQYLDELSKKSEKKIKSWINRKQSYTAALERFKHVQTGRLNLEFDKIRSSKIDDQTSYYPLLKYCTSKDEPKQFFIYKKEDWQKWGERINQEYDSMKANADSFSPIMCHPR